LRWLKKEGGWEEQEERGEREEKKKEGIWEERKGRRQEKNKEASDFLWKKRVMSRVFLY